MIEINPFIQGLMNEVFHDFTRRKPSIWYVLEYTLCLNKIFIYLLVSFQVYVHLWVIIMVHKSTYVYLWSCSWRIPDTSCVSTLSRHDLVIRWRFFCHCFTLLYLVVSGWGIWSCHARVVQACYWVPWYVFIWNDMVPVLQ